MAPRPSLLSDLCSRPSASGQRSLGGGRGRRKAGRERCGLRLSLRAGTVSPLQDGALPPAWFRKPPRGDGSPFGQPEGLSVKSCVLGLQPPDMELSFPWATRVAPSWGCVLCVGGFGVMAG